MARSKKIDVIEEVLETVEVHNWNSFLLKCHALSSQLPYDNNIVQISHPDASCPSFAFPPHVVKVERGEQLITLADGSTRQP